MPRLRWILASFGLASAGLISLTWGQISPPSSNVIILQAEPDGALGSRRSDGETTPITAPAAASPFAQDLSVVMRASEDPHLNLQIDTQVRQLVDEADAAKKAELEKSIKESLAKQFDDRQTYREEELVQLEEQVRQLRELFDKRQKAKDDIIDNRLQELVRGASGLGWGEGAPPRRGGPGGGHGSSSMPRSRPGYKPASGFPPTFADPSR